MVNLTDFIQINANKKSRKKKDFQIEFFKLKGIKNGKTNLFSRKNHESSSPEIPYKVNVDKCNCKSIKLQKSVMPSITE